MQNNRIQNGTVHHVHVMHHVTTDKANNVSNKRYRMQCLMASSFMYQIICLSHAIDEYNVNIITNIQI